MLNKIKLRLRRLWARFRTPVLTLGTWQKPSETRMRIFTIQRFWRHWALPLHVELHNVEFMNITITRVGVLCFMFEYEVHNFKHKDLEEVREC